MMTLPEIERTLRQLRLSGIAATLGTRVMQAQTTQQPFLETLAAMLQDELDRCQVPKTTGIYRSPLDGEADNEPPKVCDTGSTNIDPIWA